MQQQTGITHFQNKLEMGGIFPEKKLDIYLSFMKILFHRK